MGCWGRLEHGPLGCGRHKHTHHAVRKYCCAFRTYHSHKNLLDWVLASAPLCGALTIRVDWEVRPHAGLRVRRPLLQSCGVLNPYRTCQAHVYPGQPIATSLFTNLFGQPADHQLTQYMAIQVKPLATTSPKSSVWKGGPAALWSALDRLITSVSHLGGAPTLERVELQSQTPQAGRVCRQDAGTSGLDGFSPSLPCAKWQAVWPFSRPRPLTASNTSSGFNRGRPKIFDRFFGPSQLQLPCCVVHSKTSP